MHGRVTTKPARWWIGTVPHTDTQFDDLRGRSDWPPNVRYIVGQREVGSESGFDHWQVCVNLVKPQRLSWFKDNLSNTAHWEPTRSDAAIAYCTKEETSVPGTRFEYGTKPVDRSSSKDWDAIKDSAIRGRLDDIPSDVYIRCYQSLRRIESDHLVPIAIERKVMCFWGRTGSGKSHRAWEEATLEAYPKDPRSKFWDGYRGHENVVIDEFRGGIDIAHLLRWFDRYPCIVEVKGSSTVLKAKAIWITSNLAPEFWYPDLDKETLSALLRRMDVVYFP